MGGWEAGSKNKNWGVGERTPEGQKTGIWQWVPPGAQAAELLPGPQLHSSVH